MPATSVIPEAGAKRDGYPGASVNVGAAFKKLSYALKRWVPGLARKLSSPGMTVQFALRLRPLTPGLRRGRL